MHFLPRKANLILACRPNRSFTGCAFVLILFNQNGSGKNWEEFCQNFPAQELRRKSASGKVPRRARFEKAESLGHRHWTPAYLASKRTGLNCTVHDGRNFQYLSKKNWDQSKFEGLYTQYPIIRNGLIRNSAEFLGKFKNRALGSSNLRTTTKNL